MSERGVPWRPSGDDLTPAALPRHPARFSTAVLDRLVVIIDEATRADRPIVVLDPFAGVGGIHLLAGPRVRTVGVELEPEWAAAHPHTLVGDATALPIRTGTIDAVITSPCYGNRMADHHEARDQSTRNTYRHALGRPLTPGSAGAMQWGPAYRDMHARAWAEARRVLRPGGLLVVNVSNHIRGGEVQPVVEWHLGCLLHLGFAIDRVEKVETPRLRYGANRQVRVDNEHLLVVRKVADAAEFGTDWHTYSHA